MKAAKKTPRRRPTTSGATRPATVREQLYETRGLALVLAREHRALMVRVAALETRLAEAVPQAPGPDDLVAIDGDPHLGECALLRRDRPAFAVCSCGSVGARERLARN